MPVAPGDHDGITGVTFGSGGHRLLGTLYLARGSAPKPTALLLHGCPGLQQNGDLAVALRDRGWNSLIFHYRGSWGSGGRYDELLGSFGRPLPAVGFALNVERLHIALTGEERGTRR